mmetsp:Transcript_19311/g.34022  ORF Transcript_19311/g.34022 Transcript_19311/m.34022 type:complete len:253 (+) Transcript_19311:799-1557(+)
MAFFASSSSTRATRQSLKCFLVHGPAASFSLAMLPSTTAAASTSTFTMLSSTTSSTSIASSSSSTVSISVISVSIVIISFSASRSRAVMALTAILSFFVMVLLISSAVLVAVIIIIAAAATAFSRSTKSPRHGQGISLLVRRLERHDLGALFVVFFVTLRVGCVLVVVVRFLLVGHERLQKPCHFFSDFVCHLGRTKIHFHPQKFLNDIVYRFAVGDHGKRVIQKVRNVLGTQIARVGAAVKKTAAARCAAL